MEKRIHRLGVIPAGNLALELVMFGEQQHLNGGASVERFATCIVGCDSAQGNNGVYQVLASFARTLASKDSVEEEDGEAVEACRKICDLMGWQPREV